MRTRCVVGDQFPADAARRDNIAGPVDGHDRLNVGVAGGGGHADGNCFGADRDTADVGLKVHGGKDVPRPSAQGGTDVVPILALAQADDRARFGQEGFVVGVQWWGHG